MTSLRQWWNARGTAVALLAAAFLGCNDAIPNAPAPMRSSANPSSIVVPGSGRWASLPDRPVDPSEFSCAARVGTSMYVYGGGGEAGGISEINRLDIPNETWHLAGELPGDVSPQNCSLHQVGNKWYFVPLFANASLWRVDPETNQWTPRASSHEGGIWSASAATATHIYKIGGNGSTMVDRYSPGSNTWFTVAPLPVSLMWHSAIAVGNRIYVFGGIGNPGNVYVYDAATDTWETRPGAPGSYFAFVAVVDGIIYLFHEGPTWAYAPETDTWTELGGLPGGIGRRAGVAYINRIIMTGGRGNAGLVSTSHSFRPAFAGNHAPVAAFTASTGVVEGSAVQFNDGASDVDGDELTYSWTFGDGGTSTDANPTHTYETGGQYTVTLTVNDGELSSEPKSRQVKISYIAPASPTNPGAVWVSEDNKITVTWAPADATHTGFQILRRTWSSERGAFGPWTSHLTAPAVATSVDDESIVTDQLYQYQIRACRGSSCSIAVNSPRVGTMEAPGAPTSASANTPSTTSIQVTWGTAAGAHSYRLVRRDRLPGQPWSAWGSPVFVNAPTALFLDDPVAEGRTYQYQIKACNFGGCSAAATTVPVTTGIE